MLQEQCRAFSNCRTRRKRVRY